MFSWWQNQCPYSQSIPHVASLSCQFRANIEATCGGCGRAVFRFLGQKLKSPLSPQRSCLGYMHPALSLVQNSVIVRSLCSNTSFFSFTRFENICPCSRSCEVWGGSTLARREFPPTLFKTSGLSHSVSFLLLALFFLSSIALVRSHKVSLRRESSASVAHCPYNHGSRLSAMNFHSWAPSSLREWRIYTSPNTWRENSRDVVCQYPRSWILSPAHLCSPRSGLVWGLSCFGCWSLTSLLYSVSHISSLSWELQRKGSSASMIRLTRLLVYFHKTWPPGRRFRIMWTMFSVAQDAVITIPYWIIVHYDSYRGILIETTCETFWAEFPLDKMPFMVKMWCSYISLGRLREQRDWFFQEQKEKSKSGSFICRYTEICEVMGLRDAYRSVMRSVW